jgi:hypothetical protein
MSNDEELDINIFSMENEYLNTTEMQEEKVIKSMVINKNISNIYKNYFNNEKYSDFKIIFKNSKVVYLHKFILCNSCDLFLFERINNINEMVIEDKNFIHYLSYIYTGKYLNENLFYIIHFNKKV